MNQQPTVVFYLCDDLDKDPVGPQVATVLIADHDPEPVGFEVDGRPVLLAHLPTGIDALIVRTAEVVGHDYDHYLPIMNERFGDAVLACQINWHAGANAPEKVLTAHSNGDVDHGVWGPSDPRHLRNLLRGLDSQRVAQGLDDFRVVVEGTHWSGTPYGSDPALVAGYKVPLYDVEIGSEPSSWSSEPAARAIAGAVTRVFEEPAKTKPISVLAGGGVHCEWGFSDPVLASPPSHAISLSHVLPNHWLVSGGYDGEGADAKLDACAASIVGGVDVIALHKKLKADYKDAFRRLATRLDVPVITHKALARPEQLA